MSKKSKSRKPKSRRTRSKKSVKNLALYASETKLQKDTVDLVNMDATTALTGPKFFTTPYQATWDVMNTIFNPVVNSTTGSNAMNPVLGNFIQNGSSRSQRNGRRVTMMSSHIDLVFHMDPIPDGSGQYLYVSNPELRVVQGWVKGGLDSLQYLEGDIGSLYKEIPYSRYKIIKDFIISRTGQSAMVGHTGSAYASPSMILTYKTIKLKFSWRPKGRITFDAYNDTIDETILNTKYSGWVPFLYIFNPNSDQIRLSFDHCKRVNVFKDL